MEDAKALLCWRQSLLPFGSNESLYFVGLFACGQPGSSLSPTSTVVNAGWIRKLIVSDSVLSISTLRYSLH